MAADLGVAKGKDTGQPKNLGLMETLQMDFGRFDGSGVPTHHKDGSEVSKSMRKKLRKKVEKFRKKFGTSKLVAASQGMDMPSSGQEKC